MIKVAELKEKYQFVSIKEGWCGKKRTNKRTNKRTKSFIQ